MIRGKAGSVIESWRPYFVIALLMLFMLSIPTPSSAHHQKAGGGAAIGMAIPSVAHGEVLAEYRAQILDLAAKQPRTDITLRRLAGFVEMQYFVCFWGLVPGSLSDEESPFNECSHAYVAGAHALLTHMAEMPGDQSAARALAARIEAKLASDPMSGTLCSNSTKDFDIGVIVKPNWQLIATHPPTVLALTAALVVTTVGLWGAFRLWLSFGQPQVRDQKNL